MNLIKSTGPPIFCFINYLHLSSFPFWSVSVRFIFHFCHMKALIKNSSPHLFTRIIDYLRAAIFSLSIIYCMNEIYLDLFHHLTCLYHLLTRWCVLHLFCILYVLMHLICIQKPCCIPYQHNNHLYIKFKHQ